MTSLIDSRTFQFLAYLTVVFYFALSPRTTFADSTISNAAKGRQIVERLSEDRRLRLSLDGLEKRFSFVISIGRVMDERTSYEAHYLVVRDQQSVAIIMLSKDGSPYGYSRIGLCALLGSESERPLLLSEGGSPKVVLKLKESGKTLVFELVFSSRLREPEILIDIPSILAEAVKKPSHISYNEAEKIVILETEHHAQITLRLADLNANAPSLDEMAIRSPSGISTVVSNISSLERDSKITTVPRKAFEALSVPKRQAPKGSLLIVPPFPPTKFGKLPNDALIIREFRNVLPGLPSREMLPSENLKSGRKEPSKVPKQIDDGLQVVRGTTSTVKLS